MPYDTAIIVFARNPEKGKVKTRLAATIGDNNALKIYELLIRHTQELLKPLIREAQLFVFYSNEIEVADDWELLNARKALQQGHDLGTRMHHAFKHVFDKQFDRAIIIGTDIYLQSTKNLRLAIDQLKLNEVVIQPVRDGGYCLLGLQTEFSSLFLNKTWSHEYVYVEAVTEIKESGRSWFELPETIDVDTEQDMMDSGLTVH